ncbi:MAG: MFS transporter [Deltaproteobacteria bacterium]|nr:MFS transporter [Deltaproteobacteria bacterium]
MRATGPERTIRVYYAFQFFFSLLLWVPVFYEYQRRFGLSDARIFRIQSLYYLAFCLAEIPTGLLADRFGSRAAMRAGAGTLLAANLLPVFWTSYAGFLLHFLFIAAARSLISGAASAYLYEHLRSRGAAAQYKRYEGRARALGLAGKVVCWGAVGYLMEWKVALPYVLTAVSSAIAVWFAWRLDPAHARSANKTAETMLMARFSGVFATIRKHPAIVPVMFQGIGIFVLARICQVNLFQPILLEKGIANAHHGAVMGLMTLFEALGSWRPDLHRASDRARIVSYTVLIAASLVVTGYGGQVAALIGLCVFAFGVGLSTPVQMQMMNDAIPDSGVRATVLSLESIVDRAVCAAVAAVVGGFVARGEIARFLVLSSGAAVAVVTASAYFSARRSRAEGSRSRP